MKILFIGGYPSVEEPVKNVFFQKLVWGMADKGVECTVIAPVPFRGKNLLSNKQEQYEITPKGNKIHLFRPVYISYSSYNLGKFNTMILSELAFRKAVRKQAKKIEMNFDAIYGHFILRGGLAAVELSDTYGIPAFFACGESDIYKDTFAVYPMKYAKKISGCKGVISVSSKNKKDLVDCGLFKNNDILVAPNAVDLTLFRPGDKNTAREKLGLPRDEFIVAFAGYFIDRKGDKRVLEASEGLNVKLAFAGRGDNPPSGEQVAMARALNHNEMPLLYQSADIFVLPTLAEGCCNSIVEAMACGLPIISSDMPFNDDILDDTNSIRIDPNNIQQIHDAIAVLLNNDELRIKLGTSALKFASNLTIEERAKKIIEFIHLKG